MVDEITAGAARKREDEYFHKKERELIARHRHKKREDAELESLMKSFGVRAPELARELVGLGFDLESFRVLHLLPLVEVAWADGGVSARERERIVEIARMRGVREGSAAFERLSGWLNEKPSNRFFKAGVEAIRATLRHRPAAEAQALHRDLLWYCEEVANASGGLLGLTAKISAEERGLLTRFAAELAADHASATRRVEDHLLPERPQ